MNVRQLRDVVRQLQNDAKDQLFLEYESQATFEYHNSQIIALRGAFSTLSDVVMGEIDVIRTNFTRKGDDTESLLGQIKRDVVALQRDMLGLNVALDAWSIKERDWAKDTELLKVSHAHLSDWMQQLQKDMALLRDDVHEQKQQGNSCALEVRGEAASLKQSWNRQIHRLTKSYQSAENTLSQHSEELCAQRKQRMDDLELLEKAITTVQQQHMRLRASIFEQLKPSTGMHSTPAARSSLSEIDALRSTLAAFKLDTTDIRRALTNQERDVKCSFDNISRVLNVIYGALHHPQVGSEGHI